jgi:hypothetical protein
MKGGVHCLLIWQNKIKDSLLGDFEIEIERFWRDKYDNIFTKSEKVQAKFITWNVWKYDVMKI